MKGARLWLFTQKALPLQWSPAQAVLSSRGALGGLAAQAGCPTSMVQSGQASPVSGSMRITLPPSMQATQSFPSTSMHIPSGIRSSSSRWYTSLGQAAGEAQDSSPGMSRYEQCTPEFKYQQLPLSLRQRSRIALTLRAGKAPILIRPGGHMGYGTGHTDPIPSM